MKGTSTSIRDFLIITIIVIIGLLLCKMSLLNTSFYALILITLVSIKTRTIKKILSNIGLLWHTLYYIQHCYESTNRMNYKIR